MGPRRQGGGGGGGRVGPRSGAHLAWNPSFALSLTCLLHTHLGGRVEAEWGGGGGGGG